MKKITDLFFHITSRLMVDENECWLWQGSLNSDRYGSIGWKPYTVHKFMWEYHYGKVPKGLMVCHKCDVRHCCNPHHLFLGTNIENLLDAGEKGRRINGIVRSGFKLKTKEALQIKNDDRSASVIAKEHNLNRSQVWKIKTGRRWAWLVTGTDLIDARGK